MSNFCSTPDAFVHGMLAYVFTFVTGTVVWEWMCDVRGWGSPVFEVGFILIFLGAVGLCVFITDY